MFVVLHIVAGFLALVGGSISFASKKGSPLHKRAGKVFVFAMLIMSASGAMLAWYLDEWLNMVAGLVTFYLVLTAYFSVQPLSAWRLKAHIPMALFGFIVGLGAVLYGVYALQQGLTSIDGNPTQVIVVFGGLGIVGAMLDAKIIVTSQLRGKSRLVRHAWRMGLAMFLAAASFFLGQSQFMPEYLQHIAILAAPVLLVLLLTLYWIMRLSIWGFR